jgi:hypothetical protein
MMATPSTLATLDEEFKTAMAHAQQARRELWAHDDPMNPWHAAARKKRTESVARSFFCHFKTLALAGDLRQLCLQTTANARFSYCYKFSTSIFLVQCYAQSRR